VDKVTLNANLRRGNNLGCLKICIDVCSSGDVHVLVQTNVKLSHLS